VVDGVNTEYEVYRGMEVRAGFHDPLFANQEGKCVLISPRVATFTAKVNKDMAFPEILTCDKTKTPLVLIAPDFDPVFVEEMEEDFKKGRLIVPLRLPNFGKFEIYDDINIFTAGLPITKAVISGASAFLIGGDGDTAARVKDLQREIGATESAFDKEKLEHRIANLSGGIAIIRIGADSQVEKDYFKKKMEDAVNASQSALTHGVVNGGGMILYSVSKELPPNILTEALKVPYNTIQDSFGEPTMIPESVIDATQITIDILKLACSTASTDMTIGTAIVIKREDDND
jgi:chaperonin GroEL